jgi:hypothetical protein
MVTEKQEDFLHYMKCLYEKMHGDLRKFKKEEEVRKKQFEKRREEISKIKSKTIKEAHTKILLTWLKKARACGGAYDIFDNNSGINFTIEELKEELSKREHVPNKTEAKIIRQQKAKQKRNR